MLAALVEIVGYGKMEAVTNTRLVYRSVGYTPRQPIAIESCTMTVRTPIGRANRAAGYTVGPGRKHASESR